MRNFRLLTADEVECRIKMQNQLSGVTLLLYKTARVDAKILDETFGMVGWQNKYEVINDNLYCSIGVYNCEAHDWIWKSNCGTESNQDKEKGEASDALKRAGFTWGIGTELYSAPRIWINSNDLEFTDGKCQTKFNVSEIGYDADENINRLTITGWDKTHGKRIVFSTDKSVSSTPQKKAAKEEPKPKEPKAEEPIINCVVCGREIKGGKRKDGTVITAMDMAQISTKKFGKPFCSSCYAKECAVNG